MLAFCCVGDDAEKVARALRPCVEGHGAWLGRSPEQVFTVSGTAEEAAQGVRALEVAGAGTVVLRMVGPEPVRQLGTVLKALGRQARN